MEINHEVQNQLKSLGLTYFHESDFSGLTLLTGRRGRIVCGDPNALQGKNVWPDGRSCWLHLSRGYAFIGLWSGRVYMVRDIDALCFVLSLLFAGDINAKGPASILPTAAIALGRAVEIHTFVLTAPTDSERLEQWMNQQATRLPTRAAFVAKLCALANFEVIMDQNEHLTFRIGDAEAIVRWPDDTINEPLAVQLAVFDLRPELPHHLQLLAALISSGYTLFDEVWGNRVDPTDSYYRIADGEHRPACPRNAWVST